MVYRLLADAVLLLHLGYILFVGLGGLAVLRRPKLAWLHVPAVLWGAWIEFAGWVCPLTPLENRLRLLGGEVGYGGDFIGHYLATLIYPDGLTREMQIGLGVFVLVINAGIYWQLWQKCRKN